MHLISKILAYQSLGILRPKGSIAHADIELLVAWMLEQYGHRIRNFVVNLTLVSSTPEIVSLLVRMADLAVAHEVSVAFCLPEDIDPSIIFSEAFSARIVYFADEESAVVAIGGVG